MARRLFVFSIVAIVLFAGVALVQEKAKFHADRHAERGVTCTVCHGEDAPTKAAPADKCLVCHQSLEAVAEKTKDYDKNPHQNHLTDSTDLVCTQCHNGHKADEPACNQCHGGMKFEKKKADEK